MQGYLVLENGKIFKGTRFGATEDVMAEVVFTTGMVGYLETLTSKSYMGQMVVQTFPLIGNYGVIPSDFEGDKIGPKAYIVNEWCQFPSNFRSEGNLDTFLLEQNVVGLSGIDTRALTKIIREAGSLNACIVNDPTTVDMDALKNYRVEGEVIKASTKETKQIPAENEAYKVAMLDLGLQESIVRELTARGCAVTIYPHDTKAADILAQNPNGIVLSNGPGNPAENTELIAEIKALCASGVPMFGICMGHQLLALAHGFETAKMPYGHRGSNQPIRCTKTGKVYITSQNHQYAIVPKSIDAQATVLFEHVNDLTPEALSYNNTNALSVQFYPQTSSGPQDTNFIFDDFITMLEGGKK